jgi:hypothetical protein
MIRRAGCQRIETGHQVPELPVAIDEGLNPGLSPQLFFIDSFGRSFGTGRSQLESFKKKAPLSGKRLWV